MKIAYLLLAHNNPRLLKRAIRTLSSGDCGFFIHIDKKADIRQFSAVGGKNIFFSKQRMPVHWGEFSLVQATLMMIREALEDPTHYDYFVLLSGSDYPLRSGEYIRAFFEDNFGLEFMNLTKLPAPGFPIAKINKLRYPSDKPLRRFATRALGKLGFAQRDFKKWLRGLEPYCGSQWWAMSRDAVRYTVEFTQLNPHLEEYFRNSFTSDEMFFHTILGNSPLRSQIRRNLVYLDWPKPGEHPVILTDEHLRGFESVEKVYVEDEWGSGEALFARKFSDDNLDLLDRIDEMILRKERRIATSQLLDV
jgi:Core-2/I-Branching enzyme